MSPRVASLLPSATEIICAVGAEDQLVGRSHECDHPASIADRPVLTAPRVDLDGGSRAIHEQVMASLEQAVSVYRVKVETLRATGANIVVTQDLCEVCAVARGDVEAALAELLDRDTTIISLDPKRLGDILDDVRRVGKALGRGDAAEAAAADLHRRAHAVAPSPGRRPTVLALEWVDPVMVGGLWMHEVIDLAGGMPLGPAPGEYAETLDHEALAALDPDIVLLKPCGFDISRTLAERALLPQLLPWSAWRAVREGRVFVVDGNAYFNRPGPRIVESIEVAAACLAPTGPWAERHGSTIVRLDADLVATPLR